jgi:formylglycine-generating enzyme required for sulfatase activity
LLRLLGSLLALLLLGCATDDAYKTAGSAASATSYKDPVTGMEFVFVKGGCYQMGNTFDDGLTQEKPVHEVCIDDFYLAKFVVTQAQWKEVMGDNPSHWKACGDSCPVDRVNWYDAQEYIDKLNQKTGKKYRLPTEAEWEYAARSGGKKEKWAGTSNESELADYAWYKTNSGTGTHPVGQKKPNGLGFYDMSGDIWQWMADWYSDTYYRKSPRNNPPGESSSTFRAIRGGSWFNVPWSMRTSARFGLDPTERYIFYGFRVALFPQ